MSGDASEPVETPSLRGTLFATIGLTCLGAIVVLAIALAGLLRGERPVGDGSDPSTYGFDLGDLAAYPGFAASGLPRDFMPPLDDPETIRGDEVAEYNSTHRRRPVVSTDRVVGVSIAGESRAYPVPLLEVHEVVNDELGGVPIAVSFSPLADAVVVVRRDLGPRPIRFGLSGLMLDATHLLYDRDATVGASSLWSPIRRRATSGPREGTRLQLVPNVAVLSWRDWLARHPETTVALGDEGSRLRNRRVDYAHYRGDDTLPLPVADLEGLAIEERKRPAVAVRRAGAAKTENKTENESEKWMVVPIEDFRDRRLATPCGIEFTIRADEEARTVAIDAPTPLEVVPCMRFAASLLERELANEREKTAVPAGH